MTSKPLNRPKLGKDGTKTDPIGDAHQFGKDKEVEWRLQGRQWKLVNGQLVEAEEDK